MRVSRTVSSVLLSAGTSVFIGCQSISPVGTGDSGFSEEMSLEELDTDDRIFAEVLARYAQGLIYEYHREYEDALESYLRAVKLDPGNEELNFRIAMGLLRQRRTTEAIRIIEAILERNPKSAQALSVLAMAYRIAEQPEKAKTAYESLLKIDQSDPLPYLDYASFHVLRNEMEEAKRILELGSRKAKPPLDLYLNLARIHIDESMNVETRETAHALRDQAIEYLERAAKLDKENREILFRIGDLHILNKEHDKAMEHFRAIEKAFPDHLRTKQELALRFLATGDIEEAISTLESISRDDPSNPQVYYYLGELYLENSNLEKAVESFRLSVAATEDDPLPYIRLSMLLQEHDGGAAIDLLYSGLEKMPGNGRLSEELAYLYWETGRHELAYEWFRKAVDRLKAEEVGPRFHYLYARAAYEMKYLEDSLTHLIDAANANHLFLYFFLQESLANSGVEELVEFFHSYVGRRPLDPAAHISLGILHSALEDFQTAIRDFEKAGELTSKDQDAKGILDGEYYFSYAAAHERVGNIGTAEKFFLQAIDLDPTNVKAHNYLSYMWAEHNINLDRALIHVEIALEAEPDSAAYVDTLGWIYYRQEKYEQALEKISRAAELEPDDPIITDHLGDILIKLEREEEAIGKWKQSFVLDPENTTVREKLVAHSVDLTPLRQKAAAQKTARESMGETPETPVPDLPEEATIIAETPDLREDREVEKGIGEISPLPEFDPAAHSRVPPAPADPPEPKILEPLGVH